jgi:hypothetical protein
MSRFLKLTGCMINVSNIRYILLDKPKVYNIKMTTNYFNGFILFGSGFIHSDNLEVTVCEKENPEDYKTVTEWINKN